MHVLFTTSPAIGHFHPLVPMAQALEAAGRVVAFASSPSVAATVEGSGFRFFPLGPRIDEIRASDELQEYAALTDPIARRELIRRVSLSGCCRALRCRTSCPGATAGRPTSSFLRTASLQGAWWLNAWTSRTPRSKWMKSTRSSTLRALNWSRRWTRSASLSA